MYMPKVRSFKYIVAARDDLSGSAEGRALKHAKASALAKFFWEEILCRYGAVGQVTTDNGPEVQGAFTQLMNRYGIPHITISAYNSKANGVVERGHFTIREALMKACEGKISEWPDHVPHAFFADKVTVRRATGFSPFYLLHGTQPVLPLDLAESSFLVDSFHKGMTSAELLAARIRQLQKRPEDIQQAARVLKQNRFKSKEQFEQRYLTRLRRDTWQPGTLVLVRNTGIEKDLDRKSKPRYLGPYEVVRRTQGGSYVLQELDGTVMRKGIAAFRLLPYIKRTDALLQQLAGQADDLPESRARDILDEEDSDDDERN